MNKSICESCLEKPYHCSRCSVNGVVERFGYGVNDTYIESFTDKVSLALWLSLDETRREITWEECCTTYKNKAIRNN